MSGLSAAGIGTAAGMGAGGLLGHIGDTLSMPRKALWSLLGLPDSGADMVSQMSGLDHDSPLAKILGFGAETLLDPLTYLGGPIGGALGKVGARLGAGENLAGHIGVLTDARRAAMESMVARAAEQETNLASQAGRFNRMRSQVDVPGMADVATHQYAAAKPEAIAALEGKGMGQGTPGGGAVLFGERKPAQLSLERGGKSGGSTLGVHPDMSTGAMENLSPYERFLVMSKGNAAGGGKALGSVHSPDILGDVAAQRGAEINAAMPEPSLSQAMEKAFMPKNSIDTMRNWDVGRLPVSEGFDETQRLLAMAMAKQKEREAILGANQLTGFDRGALIGGGGLAAFLGGLSAFGDQ